MANPLICVFNPVTSFIDEVQSVSSGPASNGIPIVTNLLGVIDTSLLGIGSIATAGQTLSAGQLVNLYSFAGTLHAQVASAQSPTVPNPTPPTPPSGGPYPLQAQGFAASSATVGTPLTISFFGTFKYIDGNSEFHASDIGSEVYLSDRGDGSPTLTPPSGGGELEQSVGYVVAFVSPNVVTINFASGFQDFSHISGVNPISKGGTGATTASQALINLIGSGSAGQAVVWNGSAWVPGFDNAPFNQISSGTNTIAAMTVGTGASITFSGSGTINANQLTGDPVNTAGRVPGNALVWNGSAWAPSGAAMTSFTDITSGTNTTATMTVGTGATLTFSPTGVINANQLYNVVISNVAPSVGQSLTATGASAADWETIVAAGTANQIAFYSSSGHSVSGDTLLTDNGTTLSYTGTGGISSAHLIATTDLVIAGGTALTTSNQTGTGSIVLATGPTISGATLSGVITTSGTETYTTANPTFFSATGTGAVALAVSPTFTGEVTLARLKASSPDVAGILNISGSATTTYNFASNYTGTNPPVVIVTPLFNFSGGTQDFWVTFTGSAGAWTAFTINVSSSQTSTPAFTYFVIDIG